MQNKIHDGRPAFPSEEFPDSSAGKVLLGGQGMSIRDYFAVNCNVDLGGYTVEFAEIIVGDKSPSYQKDPAGFASFSAKFRAKMRYLEADAMLQARIK